MDQKRVHQRFQVPRVLVKIATADRMRVAYLKDLSEGGVFIKTDRPIALDRVIDVDLLPPGRSEPLRLRGKIVRVVADEQSKKSQSAGMAVRFVDLEPDTQAGLRAILDDYQNPPSDEPVEAAAPDPSMVQLKKAVEDTEAIRQTLAARERELQEERERRQELTAQLLELTQELEKVRSKGDDGAKAALETVRLELMSSRTELSDLRTRLAEAEGNTEAYRQELGVMEEDDANTRRLAESLAQHKARLEQELKKAREETAEARRQLAAETTQSAQRSGELQRRVDDERAHRVDFEKKLDTAGATKAQLEGRVAELESMLTEARKHMLSMGQVSTELEQARAKVAQAEQALEREKQKGERARGRERELRQLLAAVSTSKGDDVVMVEPGGGADEDEIKLPEPTPMAPEEAEESAAASEPELSVAAGAPVKSPEPEIGINLTTTTPAPEPEPGSEVSEISEVSETSAEEPAVEETAALPPEPTTAVEETSLAKAAAAAVESDDDSEDVEVDWGNQVETTVANPGDEFLRRLRANQKLIRLPRFNNFTPGTSREEKVMGILEACEHFDDLKVLARGIASAEQLEEILISFHSRALISCE